MHHGKAYDVVEDTERGTISSSDRIIEIHVLFAFASEVQPTLGGFLWEHLLIVTFLIALLIATLLGIELLDHLSSNVPAVLDTLQRRAMLVNMPLASGRWFCMPRANIILVHEIFLIECRQDLTKEGKPR